LTAGPPPGFRSRGKNHKGSYIFSIQYWIYVYAATGGPIMKWGGRTPLAMALFNGEDTVNLM